MDELQYYSPNMNITLDKFNGKIAFWGLSVVFNCVTLNDNAYTIHTFITDDNT